MSYLDYIDVYRVLELFEVDNNAIAHAIKKLLCAGIIGSKNEQQDIQEAIDSLERWKDMRNEDFRLEIVPKLKI